MSSADHVVKHLTCCICLEVFNVPKTLPCLHSFCETCLQGHILRTELSQTEYGEYFECPLCRAKTYSVNDVPKSQWAKSFPTNHAIVSLLNDSMITTNATQEREPTDDIVCMPCKADDKQTQAYCFCIQCMEYYCKNCYEEHRKFKATQKHTVLIGNDLPTDISAFDRMTRLKFCDFHPDKEIEFKCINDGKYICSICATTSHRKCGNITHLHSAIEDRTPDVKECLSNIIAFKSDVEYSLHSRLKAAEDLDKESINEEKDAKELFKQLNAFINKIRQDFLANYAEKVESERKNLSTGLKECFGLIENINQLICFADTVLKYGSKSQVALINENLREEHISLMESMPLERNPYTDSVDELRNYEENTLNRVIEENLPERIKRVFTSGKSYRIPVEYTVGVYSNKQQVFDSGLGDLPNEQQQFASVIGNHPGACCFNEQQSFAFLLGNRSRVCSNRQRTFASRLGDHPGVSSDEPQNEPQKVASLPDSRTSAAACSSEQQTLPFQPSTYALLKMKAHKVAEHDISISGFLSSCCHTGSVLLPNGNMVFIDKNNKLLKVITPAFKIAYLKVLVETPVDICSRGENKIAVALDKSIIEIEVADNPTSKILSTKNKVRSICQVGDNLAILFEDSSTEDNSCFIEIRSNSNRIVKTIDSFKNVVRKVEKLKSAKLIRSHSEDELLVCTRSSFKQVISLDQNWCEKWYFKHPTLRNASYIAMDTIGNKYLCDTDSGVICQISAKACKHSRIIIEDIENPASVLFNEKDKALIIGCLNDDKVHVYQFQ